MIHRDLFSGIGGFAYAVDQVWDNVEHIFCDNNKFCQEVLKKHWKGSVIYEDIRDVTYANWYRLQEQRKKQQARQERREDTRRGGIDLLTGGFPCQPFSQAGKRRGTSDDRFLWPEMFRVIQEFKPTWVIAENVRGILTIESGMVFEQVCLDLEREGYEVQPFIIPACAVNAPHRRDRVWIVAHAKSSGYRGSASKECGVQRQGLEPEKQGRGEARNQNQRCDRISGNANNEGLERYWKDGECAGKRIVGQADWQADWREVASSTCDVRVDDGLPAELDGFKLTKAGHRVERLKALGNAIVPQVAIEIMKAIKYAEEN